MSIGTLAGGGFRLAGKYIGIPIAGAVGLGALPHLAKISQSVAGFGQPEADPTATTPPSTASTPAPGAPGTPA